MDTTVEVFPLSDSYGPYTKYEYRPSVVETRDGRFTAHAKRYRYYGGGNWDFDGEYGGEYGVETHDTYEEAMADAVYTVEEFAQMEADNIDSNDNDRHYWIDASGEWHLERRNPHTPEEEDEAE